MKVVILGWAKNRYCQQLLRACQARDIECGIYSYFDISCLIIDNKSEVLVGGSPLSSDDIVLVRSMPSGSLEQVIFRMDALWVATQSGVTVVNSPKALEVAIDKYLSQARMQNAGILTPNTYVGQTAMSAMEWFEANDNDAVVKPLFGGEGRGIFRVSNVDLAWRSFQALERIGTTILLQQFIDHGNQDTRVLLFGDRHFAIKRKNNSDWRTNVSRGATAEKCELADDQLELARKARQALGVDFAGVDLITDREGRLYVLEINAVPGWDAVANTLNVDIAKLLIDWAVSSDVKSSER